MHAFLERIISENEQIKTFCFRPESPVRYTAGQYIEMTLPHDNPDDRGANRWFTLSSSPTDEYISITTRLTPGGSSFKKALAALQAGNGVTISEPMGDFVLPKLLQTPLIFVAGGIGITPFHSMLEWMAATGEERPVTMLYGVKSEDDIIFRETARKAGVHLTVVVEEPSSEWGGERGRLTADIITGITRPTEDALLYVSGPEAMVEGLQKDLLTAGIDRQQIVTDTFPGYAGI